MSNQIQNIKKLLIDGKEYKAFDALSELLKSAKNGKELLNQVFLLQARLEGIETKFNQGITSYEKWEISRNKILKSALDLIDKVGKTIAVEDVPMAMEKGESVKFTATNATLMHQLAKPELVRRVASYYVLLWILLGAMDTLIFQVQDPDLAKEFHIFGITFQQYSVSEGVVPWLKDFIGHLFAFGTVTFTIILEVAKDNLNRTSTLVLNKINDLYRKCFPFLMVVLIGVIAVTIYFNFAYTTQQSSVKLWTKVISPQFLPTFIAANFYIIVVIPLVLGIFHYCLLLHVTIKEFKSFSSYNPFHGDHSFGLLTVGRSIFWGTLAFVILMLCSLLLQLLLKNGELTFGIFLGTLFFLVLVWFGAINPLKKLSKKLKLEKERLYETVKEEVRSNNRLMGSRYDLEELNTAKLLLDASRDNEKELLELRILPITAMELLAGGALILLLLVLIVYQIN